MTNKSQTIKKGTLGNSGGTVIGVRNKQHPEVDQLMNKFNNSLAIQNMGVYSGAIGLVGTNSKSRNANMGSFKTTASIGSTKSKQLINNTQMVEGTSLKSTMLKNSMIATAESTNKKQLSNSKFNPNATNTNLYSMIYQNRSKNLVSNYLKAIDT